MSSLAFADDDYAECFRKLQPPFKSWTELFKLREQRICQSGAVYAEIWSDQVTQLLADHWELLPELAGLAPKESSQREFVVQSIDVTCPVDRCARIKHMCISSCPPKLGDLCARIQQRIADAE